MTGAEIVAAIDRVGVAIACIDGELAYAAELLSDDLRRIVAERRQDVAIALMEERGDYAGEACAHELRVLKAIQGGITTDITALEDVYEARMAVERAHQALADVQRLAKNYRWLADPVNAASPDFVDRLKWAGHAALRLVAAAAELDALARPAARQEALL